MLDMLRILFVLYLTVSVTLTAQTQTTIIVSLHDRLWQTDVRDLLLTSSCTRLHPYPIEFVWRTNEGVVSSPTDFGVLRVAQDTQDKVTLAHLQTCFLQKLGDKVRRVDLERDDHRHRSLLSADGLLDGEEGWGAFEVSRHLPWSWLTGNQQQPNSISRTRSRKGTNVKARGESNRRVQHHRRELLDSQGYNNFIPASIAGEAHRNGRTGKSIKVAIFDSGLNDRHPDFRHVTLRTNWTSDATIDDKIGHGSFVAAVIAGVNKECPGIAPDSEIFVFRVFTSAHQSYTSWFLDAFNYALFLKVDVINFSIGGPDHFDHPFTDKIRELSANGIIVVSAVGNDGPLWGSIFSPADQMDVLSVGGWGKEHKLADFSSRGMTTAEIAWSGMGRMKPDILAQSVLVYSSSANSPYKCTQLSGTSVAAPVVTGAVVTLLSASNGTTGVSSSRISHRSSLHNIAAIKQIIMSSSRRLKGDLGLFEQGQGLLDLPSAVRALPSHRPHASLYPQRVSNLPEDCPYMWPWCRQAMYVGAQPLIANLTLFNSMGVLGRVVKLQWIETREDGTSDAAVAVDIPYDMIDVSSTSSTPSSSSTSSSSSSSRATKTTHHRTFTLPGRAVTLRIQCSERLWPWTGFVAVAAYATASSVPSGSVPNNANSNGRTNTNGNTNGNGNSNGNHPFVGIIRGRLSVTVESQPSPTFPAPSVSTVPLNAASNNNDNAWSTDNTSYIFNRSRASGGSRGVRGGGGVGVHSSTTAVDIVVKLQPTPPRNRRMLWDAYHNIDYPSGYIPRDDISSNRNSFDWLGDHLYTNQRKVFNWLLDQGYYVEILRSPWTCFDASQYNALVVVDPEEILRDQEVVKLEQDIRNHGLSLLIVADWFDEMQMVAEEYEDENTRSLWHAVTGGSNIPALNKLLSRFGALLGLQAFDGKIKIDGRELKFLSGNTIARWPQGGVVLHSLPGELKLSRAPKEEKDKKLRGPAIDTSMFTMTKQAIAGFLQTTKSKHKEDSMGGITNVGSKGSIGPSPVASNHSRKEPLSSSPSSLSSSNLHLSNQSGVLRDPLIDVGGRIVVYGDSSCFEVTFGDSIPNPARPLDEGCEVLLSFLFDYLMTGHIFVRDNRSSSSNSTSNGPSPSPGGVSVNKLPATTPVPLSSSSIGTASIPLIPTLEQAHMTTTNIASSTNSDKKTKAEVGNISFVLPAGTSPVLRSLWGQLELLSHGEMFRRELLNFAGTSVASTTPGGHGISALSSNSLPSKDREKIELHRRGRAWEMSRCSKSFHISDKNFMDICDKIL